ncbi:MAG: ferric reductase-like transmembrane domain-containing protein [Candidatus Saccharimonas sp.]
MQESTKRHLLITVILLSLIPAIFLPHFPSLVSTHALSLYASAIFGYIGIVLLMWMYILGAKSLMGHVFTDLAPVLRIHKWLGKYGTLAIFIHPLLITFSYGESLLYSFIPLIGTWAERHILLGQLAFWVLLNIWVGSALIRGRMPWRVWKYMHYLAYICVPFVLLHIPDLGSQQRTYPLVNAYFAMLVATFIIISIVRLVSVFNLDRTRYQVEKHVKLSAIDYMMRLVPSGRYQLNPKIGQYVYVKLGFLSEDHPFSVTQYETAKGVITVTYRLSGMYTQELARTPPGSEVLLSGPYGSFMQNIEDDDTTPIVYIAGGIGVTPFIKPILERSQTHEQWLFTSNRTRELAVLSRQLKDTLGEHAISVYSREEKPLIPGEEKGHISADILRKYLGDVSRYQYYLCGPPAMMDSMHAMLANAGIAQERVMSEDFGW